MGGDNLTVNSPGAGGTTGISTPETKPASASTPVETFLKLRQARLEARAEARDAQEASRAAHDSSRSTTSLELNNASRANTASVTGAEQARSMSTGLTPEVQKQIASDTRSGPALPLPTSAAITPEETKACVDWVFEHRTINGEPIEFEALKAEYLEPRRSTSSARSRSTGARRVGTGGAALSMRIGSGGSHLASTNTANPTTSEPRSPSPLDGMEFSWDNLAAFLIMFMMREEERSLKEQQMMKKLRTADYKSAISGRNLDFTMTDVRNFLGRHSAVRELIKTSHSTSTEMVAKDLSGAFGTDGVNPENLLAEDDSGFMENLSKKMQAIVADVDGSAATESTTDPTAITNKRTFLTDAELESLKTTDPDKAKSYESSKTAWLYSGGRARLIAVMRHDAMRLANDAGSTSAQQSGSIEIEPVVETPNPYAKQIAAAEKEMVDWVNNACRDPRGFGLAVSDHRDRLSREVAQLRDGKPPTTVFGITESGQPGIAQVSDKIERLKNEIDAEADPSKKAKLQTQLAKAETQLGSMETSLLVALETLNIIDNVLVPKRPGNKQVQDNYVAHSKETQTANEKDSQKISKKKAEIDELNASDAPDKAEQIATREFEIKELEEAKTGRNQALSHLGALMASYETALPPDDLAEFGRDDALETGDAMGVRKAPPKPLSTSDFETRIQDLNARKKAGDQFFGAKQWPELYKKARAGLYKPTERNIDATISRIGDALKKPADSLESMANRHAQGAIGSASSGAKEVNAMAAKTRGMYDRLLQSLMDNLARMQR